jgi:hypothetical protein
MYGESKMLSTTLGDDMLIEYQEGVIDNHSIGFRYRGIKFVTADDEDWSKWISMIINSKDAEAVGYMFLVDEIELYEWSPVSFGANELSPYLGVKSGNKDGYLLKINNRLDLLAKQLASGKQSDNSMMDYELETRQLKQIISELFTHEPSIKDTLINQRRSKEDANEKNTLLSTCPNCVKTFNHNGDNKCPNCGQYCTGSEVSSFDWGKALRETILIKI